MEKIKFSKRLFEVKRDSIRFFLLPIFFTILISLIYSQLVFLSQGESFRSTFLFEGYSEIFIIVNILTITIISTISLFIFFRILERDRELALRLLISTFIIGGMLSFLLFGKHIFVLLELEFPFFLLVIAFVAYVGTYFAYLAFIDALSHKARNSIFLVCSGSLGSFIGVLLPISIVIGISLFLSVVDIILISRKSVEKFVGEDDYENMILKLAFSSNKWGIGIGDLTCFSMIVASSSMSYGVFVGALSLLLILGGSALSLLFLRKHRRIPGLPLSTMLGVLPSILVIIFS
jgi:hypothetical protein